MNGTVGRLARFAVIGLINTAVDVSIFNLLTFEASLSIFVANIISTSVALGVSYLLNSRYTFSKERSARTLATFIVVTLSGQWLLQPLVISLLLPFFEHAVGQNHSVALNGAKLASIATTLVWNYVWYTFVVFKTKESTSI